MYFFEHDVVDFGVDVEADADVDGLAVFAEVDVEDDGPAVGVVTDADEEFFDDLPASFDEFLPEFAEEFLLLGLSLPSDPFN